MTELPSSPDYSPELFELMSDQELANTWHELSNRRPINPHHHDPDFQTFCKFLVKKFETPTITSSAAKEAGYPCLAETMMNR